MITRIFAAVFIAILVFAATLLPDQGYAKGSGHWSGGHGATPAPAWHGRPAHRFRRGVVIGVPYYPYGYDYAYGPPPADDIGPPAVEHPGVEKRRECEPKTYTVPSTNGGESKVTIIRC